MSVPTYQPKKQGLGRIGNPRPPGKCAYPGCEGPHAPNWATCFAHWSAYRDWKAKQAHDRHSGRPKESRESSIMCQREGCPKEFMPRSPKAMYCSNACARLAKIEQEREAARTRKENKELARTQARASSMSEAAFINRKLDEMWERVKDPEYYTGIRHREYSSLTLLANVTRAHGKSETTAKKTT